MVRGGQEGADRLDGVVRDACLAGDNLTDLHLHLEVLEGEDLHYEQSDVQGVDLAVYAQVLQELFVPLNFFACQFVPLTCLVLYFSM